jgi:hypothetical protein
LTETTATILAERRTRALRDLSASLGLAAEEAEADIRRWPRRYLLNPG